MHYMSLDRDCHAPRHPTLQKALRSRGGLVQGRRTEGSDAGHGDSKKKKKKTKKKKKKNKKHKKKKMARARTFDS